MKQRTNIIDIFSTFLEVKDDYGNLTQWLYNLKLKKNIERQEETKPNLIECESIWIQYWFNLASENKKIEMPQKHLQSYLQEPCFWATQEMYPKLASAHYKWNDIFQEAGFFTLKKTLKIFEKYNWDLAKKSNIRAWCQQKIKDFLKELYLQKRRIEGASNWRILRDTNTSLKMWEKILHSANIEQNQLPSYLLALECFKNHYEPMIKQNQRLPEPTVEQWQKILTDYNLLKKSHKITAKINLEIIKELLEQCVCAIRKFYKIRPNISLELELEVNTFEPKSDDQSLTEKLEKEEEWQQVFQILSQDFLSLASEEQTFLNLAYGVELGQTEIAKLFSLKQYQVSRKLDKYRQFLLTKWVYLKEEHLARKLTKEEISYLAKQINQWLRDYCKQQFYEFLEDILLQDLEKQLTIVSFYYINIFSLKKLDAQKSLLIKTQIAENLNITLTHIEQSLEFSHNYLLQKFKTYIPRNLQLSKPLDSNLIPTIDQTLLNFIYLFLKNVSYAQLFVKMNDLEL